MAVAQIGPLTTVLEAYAAAVMRRLSLGAAVALIDIFLRYCF
jgi:hypothetical protein